MDSVRLKNIENLLFMHFIRLLPDKDQNISFFLTVFFLLFLLTKDKWFSGCFGQPWNSFLIHCNLWTLTLDTPLQTVWTTARKELLSPNRALKERFFVKFN